MTIPMPKKEYISIKMAPEHSRRYQQLMSTLTKYQRGDRSYMAACYLLSADDDVFEIADGLVDIEGIDFAMIRTVTKKKFGASSSTYTAVEVGYSLFSWKDCRVNPHDMAQSGAFWLPIICNALLIQGNAANVEVAE